MCLGWTKLFSLLCQLSSSLGYVDMLLVKMLQEHRNSPATSFGILSDCWHISSTWRCAPHVSQFQRGELDGQACGFLQTRSQSSKESDFFLMFTRVPQMSNFNQCYRFLPVAVALGTTRRISIHAKAWCCKRFSSESMYMHYTSPLPSPCASFSALMAPSCKAACRLHVPKVRRGMS